LFYNVLVSRFSYKTLILILLFLLIPIVLFLRISQRGKQVSAEWFNDSWNYRQRVDITNSSGSDLTDFQVSIDIGTSALIAAGKMQSDCDDIRITDQNGNLLPYWIEENNPGCNQVTDTKIWVKAPSLPTSGAPIYFYYGNTSATSAQNGNDVFEFFDDFNGSTIDTNKWTQGTTNPTSGTQFTISGGNLIGGNQNRYLQSINSFTGNYITKSRTYTTTPNSNGFMVVGFWASTSNSLGILDHNGTSYYRNDSTWGGFALNGNSQWTNNSVKNIGTSANYSRIGNTSGSVSGNLTNSGVSNEYVRLGSRYDNGNYDQNYTASWDWVFVSKAVSIEPTATPASEEVGGGPIAYWKFDEGVGTTAYDSTHSFINFRFGTGDSAPSWTTEDQCVSGKCIYFDGTSQELYGSDPEIANVDPDEVRTFSAWFKASPTSNNQTIFWKEGSCIGISSYIETDGDFNTTFRTGTGCTDYTTYSLVISDADYNDNKWHFQTFIIDRPNEKLTIYIDGKKKGERSIDNTGQANMGTLKMGNLWNNTWPLKGFIDEAKIYIYARTADQIKADYAAGLAGMSSSSDSSVNIGGASTKSLSDGLIGYWKMDEGVGTTTVDSSGNGNLATFGAGDSSPSWTSGKYGVGTSFDGINDYLDAGNNPSFDISGPLTISVWVKPDVGSGQQGIIGNTVFSNPFGLYLRHSPGSDIGFWVNPNGNRNYIMAGTVNYGSWNHIVGTWDGANLLLYLNNLLISSSKTTGSYTRNTQNLLIGNVPGIASPVFYSGLIDEVRIYNRALGASEIAQLFQYAPPPVGYWKFEEGVGTTAYDSSGSNNHAPFGTGSSAPSWTTGKYGKALNFDGTNDYISATDSTTLDFTSAFTASAWIYPTTYGGMILNKWNGTSGQKTWFIGMLNSINKFYITLSADGSTQTYYAHSSTQTISYNTWHHVSFVYDGTRSIADVYLDGYLVNFPIKVGTIPTVLFNGSNPMSIGNLLDGRYFSGKIDDVKLYNYARTQKQILEDMAGSPPPGSTAKVSTPLVHYKFDEGFGSTVNNSGSIGTTANGVLATGTSAPSWTNNGKYSKALIFTSANNTKVTTPITNTNGLNIRGAISFSGWYKRNTNTGYQTLYDMSDTCTSVDWDGYLLRFTDQNLVFYASVNDASGSNPFQLSYYNANSTADTTNWHHLVATWDGTTNTNGVKMYIDGKLATQTTAVADATNMATLNGYNFITGTLMCNTHSFDGLIDEVKIYNYALSAEEVRQDYNQGSTFVFGSSNQTIGATTTSLDYCIPGDTSPCSPPVAEWKFEEGVGTTAYDSSGNNNNGIISSALWQTGKIGKGLNFNGTNATVNLGQITSLNTAGSLEFWFKYRPNGSTYERILSVFDDSNNEFRILLDNSIPRKIYWIHKKNGVTTGYQGTDFNNSLWHHVAYVSDIGTSISKMYLDGINIYSTTGNVQAYNYSANWHLGSSTGTNYWFPGTIDQVRVYNYARTPAQIAYDYNQGAPVGHWKLDECQGTAIHDSSGNANHGTLSIGASGTQTSPGTCTTSSTAWANGKLGKINASLNFDGSDDHISLGNNRFGDLGDNITISAWVKTSSSRNNMILTEYESGVCGDASFQVTTTNLLTFSDGSSSSITGNKIINVGQWHHIVFVSRLDSSELYVDGVLDTTSSDVNWRNSCSNTDVKIGSRSVTSTYPFHGQIDDVRVYNYDLTPTQIKTLYNNGAVTFR